MPHIFVNQVNSLPQGRQVGWPDHSQEHVNDENDADDGQNDHCPAFDRLREGDLVQNPETETHYQQDYEEVDQQ